MNNNLIDDQEGLNLGDAQADLPELDKPTDSSGFIRFYGLYWTKEVVSWRSQKLLGQPKGWMGKGNVAANHDAASVQMNFWEQKGVYILYNRDLHPVYAGQAGLTRKDTNEGGTIGARLNQHQQGIYRNGWSLFSWFGFMETSKINLREADENERHKPDWQFKPRNQKTINALLASFEAVLIEGFAPRFNARGGDLGKAVLVNQFENSKKMN